MASFLYYLPGKDHSVDGSDIEQAGIGHALRYNQSVPSLTSVGVKGGPDGGSGVIVARSEFADRVGFYPDAQTWKKAPGGRYWIGWSKESSPGPDALARPNLLRGHRVKLADGNDWMIPVARAWSEQSQGGAPYIALPRVRELNAEGQWANGAVLPDYRDLWDMACRWWDTWMEICAEIEQDSVTLSFNDETDFAVAALCANYHVDRLEASVLGLLTDASVIEILGALIDWPTIVAWQAKKNSQPDGSNTVDGVTAATPDTVRP